MSLVVWLPLIENKNNQGTNSSLKFSYDNLTQQSDGKLGKCYSGQAVYHLDNEFLGNQWSLCAWVKSASWSQYNDIILCKNTSESTSSQFYFSIINGTTFNIGINAGSSSASVSYTFATNTWYHVAATYDGSVYTLYINGEQKKTGTITNALMTGMNNLCINCRSTNVAGTSQTGDGGKKLNDVRIYDECLSPLQVHELAQGLILHYRLDGQNNGLINPRYEQVEYINRHNDSRIETNYYFNAETDSCKVIFQANNLPSSGNQAIFASNGSKYFMILISSSSIQCQAQNGSGVETISGPAANTNRHIAEYKNKHFYVDGTDYGSFTKTYTADGGPICIGGYATSTVFDGKISYIEISRNNILQKKYLPAKQMYSGFPIGMYELVNQEFLISNYDSFYGGPLNSNLHASDSSGYNHHGTETGTIYYSPSTTHYDYSKAFNGEGYIKVPPLFSQNQQINEFSISFWFMTLSSSISFFHFGNSFLNLSWTNKIIKIGRNVGNTNLNSNYTYQDLIIFDHWYFINYVFKNGISNLYIDNELIYTLDDTAYGTVLTCDNIDINNWALGGPYNNYQFLGYLTDFRIYTTALTVNDIDILYKTAMFIDNKSNVLPYKILENNSGTITNTYMFNDNIIEPFITLSDGSNWQLLLFHKVDNGTRLFTSANATYCNNYGLYSRLAYINNFTYNSKYEFYVIQDGKEFRWTQTSQPTAASIAGKTVISGYSDPVNGLAKASQSNTYIGYSSWWGACGCWTQFSTGGRTGIPGFGPHDGNGICTDYLALYARIDKPYAFKEDGSIQANEFIER